MGFNIKDGPLNIFKKAKPGSPEARGNMHYVDPGEEAKIGSFLRIEPGDSYVIGSDPGPKGIKVSFLEHPESTYGALSRKAVKIEMPKEGILRITRLTPNNPVALHSGSDEEYTLIARNHPEEISHTSIMWPIYGVVAKTINGYLNIHIGNQSTDEVDITFKFIPRDDIKNF